jgi:hypothetical protein
MVGIVHLSCNGLNSLNRTIQWLAVRRHLPALVTSETLQPRCPNRVLYQAVLGIPASSRSTYPSSTSDSHFQKAEGVSNRML